MTPRFVVTQGVMSMHCLEELKRFFDVGRIFVNQRHDNHKEHLGQYIVSNRSELVGTVIPFFERHPLLTSKREDLRSSRVVSR